MKIKYIALLFFLPSITFADVIPTNLQWPVKNKDIRHVSIFFDSQDSIKTIPRSCSGKYPQHLGIDIHTETGALIYPTQEGIVRKFGNASGWGGYVVLSHDNNSWTSVYWHLQDVGEFYEGQILRPSDPIGKVFDTSPMQDIPHLHFGLRPKPFSSQSQYGYNKCNGLEGFVDPLPFLQKSGYAVLDDKDASFGRGNWIESTTVDFFHNDGYHALSRYDNGYAINFHRIKYDGTYSLYTNFTPYSDRTTKASYVPYVYRNGKWLTFNVERFVDQTDRDRARGKNIYIGGYRLMEDDIFAVVVSNGDISSGALITDRFILRRR